MPTKDALQVLIADHELVDGLFEKFEQAGDNAHKTKQKLVERIVKELSVHAAIEEMVFYPVVRELSEDIEHHVLESLEEHHVAKWMLSEIDGMDPTHERFDAKVTVLMENIRHHVEEEQDELFPMVRKAADRQTLQELGEALVKAKKVAPTHPHPRSPDTPPANLSSLAAGLLDRVRDAVRV
jgi:hemerythrin superfamily protein